MAAYNPGAGDLIRLLRHHKFSNGRNYVNCRIVGSLELASGFEVWGAVLYPKPVYAREVFRSVPGQPNAR